MNIALVASIGGLKPGPYVVALVEALERAGRRQDVCFYAGASGGSIWTALAASGMPGGMMADLLLSIESKELWEDWNYLAPVTGIARSLWDVVTLRKPRVLRGFTGLMEGRKLLRWLEARFGDATFDDLATPCCILGHDINCSRACVFGPDLTPLPVRVADAVRGSCAIPFGFAHHTIQLRPGDRRHDPTIERGIWDGGIEAELPLELAIDPALDWIRPRPDLIIAVDAAGVTGASSSGEWVSIDQMGTLELLRGALDGCIDARNSLQVKAAQAAGVPVLALPTAVAANMADPGNTIPDAYAHAQTAARELVEKLEAEQGP